MNVRTVYRRDFLKSAALLGGACGAFPLFADDKTKPDPKAVDLTPYPKNGQIQFRWNNLPLTVYRAPNYSRTVTPFFTEHVRRELVEMYGDDKILNEALPTGHPSRRRAVCATGRAVTHAQPSIPLPANR